jgi:hypothetical protein
MIEPSSSSLMRAVESTWSETCIAIVEQEETLRELHLQD